MLPLAQALLSFHSQEVGSIIGKVDIFYNPSAFIRLAFCLFCFFSLCKTNETYCFIFSCVTPERRDGKENEGGGEL